MYLFKAAGGTYPRVINQKLHAFPHAPVEAGAHELVLFSMNRADVGTDRQIRHAGRIRSIKPATADLDLRFPGERASERWGYVVEMYGVERLDRPFDLTQVAGLDAAPYRPVQGFRRFPPPDDAAVLEHLMRTNGDVVLRLLNANSPDE